MINHWFYTSLFSRHSQQLYRRPEALARPRQGLVAVQGLDGAIVVADGQVFLLLGDDKPPVEEGNYGKTLGRIYKANLSLADFYYIIRAVEEASSHNYRKTWGGFYTIN